MIKKILLCVSTQRVMPWNFFPCCKIHQRIINACKEKGLCASKVRKQLCIEKYNNSIDHVALWKNIFEFKGEHKEFLSQEFN